MVTTQVIEYKLLTTTKSHLHCQVSIPITWIKPPINTYKLNIDGSFIPGQNKGGIDGGVRNFHGDWIVGFIGCFDVPNPTSTELQALVQVLELVAACHYPPIKIEEDSTELLNMFEVTSPTCNPLLSLCRLLLRRLGI